MFIREAKILYNKVFTLWVVQLSVRQGQFEGVEAVGHIDFGRTLFIELGSNLRNSLGNTALRIDHIGSTSIEGIDAKPIIDIQISVLDFDREKQICRYSHGNDFR
ncbi:GrpB family protein [Paenibacillus sp. TC-CSREp1]|uniref:GrpB family protein n=1 Tax=Paenibacillus sp. TC-CSREp1 TaxID=3410089 RepID=UPI003CF5EBD7